MIKTNCAFCGNEIYKIPSKFEGRKNVFCNDVCCTKFRVSNPSPLKKKIDFTIDENGCFNCISHKPNPKGYPQIKYNRKQQRVYKFVFEEMFGVVPEGLLIRHKCDNTFCINPEHLELGTAKDNTNDAIERGRMHRGERTGSSRLKEKQVIEIKRIFAENNVNYELIKKIATDYSVNKTTIYDIYKNRTWKHVTL